MLKKTRLVILVLSLFFMVIGVFGIGEHVVFIKQADQVEAVITDRNKQASGEDNEQIYTYVTYEYNGAYYDHIHLDGVGTKWSIGEEITIYCNPQSPTEIRTKSSGYLSGGLVIIIGILLGFVARVIQKNQPH